jgi:hypothetical protein
MQLPSIDRTPNIRPVAVESASLATGKVVPVVSVNPTSRNAGPVEPVPSVVNMINQANKPNDGEGVYSSVSDPTRRGAEAATSAKDWTIRRPAAEKVQDPPPEPISKMLMDQIKSLWVASASAVQIQQQVKSQVDITQQTGAHNVPGVVSTEVFTYSPTKINKTEKPRT